MIHEIINTVLFLLIIALNKFLPDLMNKKLMDPILNTPVTPIVLLLVVIFILGFVGIFTDGMSSEFFDVTQFKDCSSCTMNGGCWSDVLKTCTAKVDIPFVGKTCALATEKPEECKM
jgi:hypothetical protein